MMGFNTLEGGNPEYHFQTKPILQDAVDEARLIKAEIEKEKTEIYVKIKEKMQTDRRRKKKHEDSDNEITDFTD